MAIEYTYTYRDPLLGEVDCGSEDEAITKAHTFGTEARRVHWVDGEETGYDILV